MCSRSSITSGDAGSGPALACGSPGKLLLVYTKGTPDGKVEVYRYDAAGNRSQVVSGTLPGVPASITVPASSNTGAYTISWGTASGTVTAYKLFQATNAGFSGATQVYSGTALNVALSGRSNGTYYYRVQACLDVQCSGYRTGANGVTVTRP